MLALAPALALADASDEEQTLINLSQSNPMVVEDALPQNPGVQAAIGASNVDRQGDDGIFFEPQVQYGTHHNLELGASWETGVSEGAYEPGQVRGWLLGGLNRQQGFVPQLAWKAQLLSPESDAGAAAQLGLLATERFGRNRVHLNGSYRAVNAGADHTIVGVGADRQLGDRLLLVGDAYHDRAFGDDPDATGAELGANVLLGEKTALQGVVGVNHVQGDYDPRVVLSLTRQL